MKVTVGSYESSRLGWLSFKGTTGSGAQWEANAVGVCDRAGKLPQSSQFPVPKMLLTGVSKRWLWETRVADSPLCSHRRSLGMSLLLLLILVRTFCVRNEMRLHVAVRTEQLWRGAGMEGAATSEEAHTSVFFVSNHKVGTVCWRKC